MNLKNKTKFIQICTIKDHVRYNGVPGYCIKGHELHPKTKNEMCFQDKWFEPLIDDQTLEAELSTIVSYERT